jgi:L-serine dehydratase
MRSATPWVAVKAVNTTTLAMSSSGEHKFSLDAAIETMKRTGADMQAKYKETSLSGLTLAVVSC